MRAHLASLLATAAHLPELGERTAAELVIRRALVLSRRRARPGAPRLRPLPCALQGSFTLGGDRR